MRISTQNLIGPTLDWAVAKCCNALPASYDDWKQTWPHYSASYAHAGPLMDQLDMDTHSPRPYWKNWLAYVPTWDGQNGMNETCMMTGPTRLVAAMRCYVYALMGEWVDVPDELVAGAMLTITEAVMIASDSPEEVGT
jgi:hypothetical protein